MRLIKLVLISAIAFFLILTAFSLLIPSTVRISRAIDISSPREKLLPYLQDTVGWHYWNAYAKDSAGRFSFNIRQRSDTLVLSDWQAGPREFVSGMAVYAPREGTLTVQWYFDFRLKWYPWEKFGSILYDRQVGPVMEESLASLKHLVESNP